MKQLPVFFAVPDSAPSLSLLDVAPIEDLVCVVSYSSIGRVPSGAVLIVCGLESDDALKHRRSILDAARRSRRVLNTPYGRPGRQTLLDSLFRSGINSRRSHNLGDQRGLAAIRFPIYIRSAQGHGTRLSDIIASPAGLNAAIASLERSGTPPSDLLAVELLLQRDDADLYRKFSVMRIGSHVIPVHLRLSPHWWIKGPYRHPSPDTEQHERDFMLSNPHSGRVLSALELCGIEFCRIDYIMRTDGIEVFDINLHPFISIGSRFTEIFGQRVRGAVLDLL